VTSFIFHGQQTSLFQKVGTRRLLSHTVVEQIEQAIKDRRLDPGMRLPSEMELCKSFGVSRTAVREALGMLSARGLVTIEKGKGMFVNTLSAAAVTDPLRLYLSMNYQKVFVLDVIRARQAIEPSIAAVAAAQRTAGDIDTLHRDVEELRHASEDYLQLAGLDMTFHLDIARASQNPLLPLIIDPIHRLMPEIKSSIYATVGHARESALEWHTRITERIVAKDVAGARDTMVEHLRIAEEHARQTLQAQTHKTQGTAE
jgi:GntR family transcriptional regulator, transcriptional repressor for pyruvate dehydrogenase complex